MLSYIPLYYLFFLILIFGAIEINTTPAQRFIIAFFFILSTCIFLSIRQPGFGSDDLSYLQALKDVEKQFSFDKEWLGYSYQAINIEYGYYIFLATLSFFGSSSFILFGCNGLISLVFFWRASKYFYPYFAPVLLIYCSHHLLNKDFNALRLAIASSIIAFAASLLISKKFIKSIFWICVASIVQVSALLSLLPLVLVQQRIKISRLFLLSLALILINSLYPFSKLLTAIPMLEFISYKLELYSGAEMYNYTIGFFDPVNIKNIFVVILGYLTLHRLEGNEKSALEVALIFFICGSLVRIIFSDFAILAGRGFSVLSVFECWIISVALIKLLGKQLGYLAIAGYSFLIMNLNFYINTQWRGESDFFSPR